MKNSNPNILLIAPRQNNTDKADFSYMFPLGIGYISSVIKKAGYSVDCINLNHYNGSVDKVINHILDNKKYDFVGTGNTALGFSITKKIISAVRSHKSKPKIILGGAIITSEPEVVFNILNPDIAVIGEGEETILEILNSLESGDEISQVKGIMFRNKQGKIIITEKREVLGDLDSLPLPDFDGFGFEKALNHQHTNQSYSHNSFDYPRVYPILGSRGCPFNCTFCYHPNRYRKRSIDNIMKELNANVRKYKINVLLFYDECIASDRQRLLEICKRIKQLQKEIGWELKWSPQLTVHNIDNETLTALKESGAFIISFGFESFSAAVLKSMRKPITPEMIDAAYHKTREFGLGIQANFIFGDIAETKETARESLKWWKTHHESQIGMCFIQPYPGSEIYKHCVRKGIIKNKVDFIENEISANHWYNMTDKMTDNEIRQLKKAILEAVQKYRFFAEHTKEKTGKNIYSFKVKCPFCKKTIVYKNCYVGNILTYGFPLFCRNCHSRFFVISNLQKIAYKFYPYTRIIRDLQLKYSKPKK